MNETEVKKERAVLAGLSAASMDERERSREVTMEELAALVETAGGEPVAFVMQNLPSPNTRSFLGEGKIREMKELIAANECDLAVFDNELTPSQMRVLGEELGVRVPAGRVKHSWRLTGAISAERSRSWKMSLPRCEKYVKPSEGAGKRTPCLL